MTLVACFFFLGTLHLVTVECFPALGAGLSSAWHEHWFDIFTVLGTSYVFSGLGASYVLLRFWHWLCDFLRWAEVTCFPSRAWHWLSVFPYLALVKCFRALVKGNVFFRAWHWLLIFPRLWKVTCSSALGTGYVFSCIWYCLLIFPRLAQVTCFPRLALLTYFPSLSSGCLFHCTWHRLCVLLRLAQVTCFAALGTGHVFSRPFQRIRVWFWWCVFTCFSRLHDVFPRLALIICFHLTPAVCFPTTGTGSSFSDVWCRLCLFIDLSPPALSTCLPVISSLALAVCILLPSHTTCVLSLLGTKPVPCFDLSVLISTSYSPSLS